MAACGPFSRQANGNLNPPQDFLANLGQITTSGQDIEFNWSFNACGKSPPVCYSCTSNGYDAGSYDLPGAFWNARLKYKF